MDSVHCACLCLVYQAKAYSFADDFTIHDLLTQVKKITTENFSSNFFFFKFVIDYFQRLKIARISLKSPQLSYLGDFYALEKNSTTTKTTYHYLRSCIIPMISTSTATIYIAVIDILQRFICKWITPFPTIYL
ncbi:hypothetical protein I3842_08G111200 [Carya illinoinensis]|uniref:Uncharacterized protein n=1 Tax=Carya illinoinensis TaxID=32201 RepID=A0A922EBA8_CARIL|nr:hypothetical protein I3842_08G111200 [Carya illinoinensis]